MVTCMAFCIWQWRIQDGAFGANAPPHFVEEPYLILTKLYARQTSAYKTHEKMYILLAFITNSPETKVNQSQTNYETVTQHLREY